MALVAGITIILCAAYMLRMLQFSLFGDGETSMKKLNTGEWISLTAIVALVLFLGLFPQTILDNLQVTVNSLIEMIKAKGVLS
jgi:NADH-quinone oxidoreductase subunit M